MLYIMRHGKTDWNEARRLQGSSDIPLNEDGKNMAKNARDEYKDVHFDVCFCSPLSRAYETAKLVLEDRCVPIIKDDRLKEMGFGKYEGTLCSFDDENCPINIIFKDPKNYKESIDGSETFESLFARTGEFIDSIVMPLVNEGKDVLIVGHGAMNSSIVCKIKNLPIEEFWSLGLKQCKLMKLL